MIIWTKQQNFFFYVVIDLLCFYSRSLHLQQETGEEKKKFRQSTQHFSFREEFFPGRNSYFCHFIVLLMLPSPE